MNLLQQVFVLNSSRTGAAVGGGGGVFGMVLGFFALFFLQPYYNGFVRSATETLGVSPFNPMVPLTLMVIAIAMFVGPMFVGVRKEGQILPVVILNGLIRFAIIAMSLPLFIFSLIHWWFYTS